MAKLDPELHMLLATKKYDDEHAGLHENLPASQRLEDPVNISFQFSGKLEDIDVPGLEVSNTVGTVAYTRVSLATLEVLAAHPAIVSISRQRNKKLALDTSVHDIGADQVWSRSGDTFSGFSGKGVIVGIIDTGIDFRHGSFRKGDATRILKIWDQTLTAAAGETVPGAIVDATLGTSAMGYGAEYTEKQLNDILQNKSGALAVRHKDIGAHGTHVAGIAAGDGSQGGNCKLGYHYIGVAPDADLVVVRMMGLSDGDNSASLPGSAETSIDAIRYIMNEAKTRNKAVVINMSFGAFTEEMDGTSHDATAMNTLLNDNPSGFAFVIAAGNDAAHNFHAKADVPASGVLGIRFRTFPDDSDKRYVMVLYSGSNLSIQLTSPLGASGKITWVAPTTPLTKNTTANGTGGEVNISQDTDRIQIEIKPPASGNNTAGEWLMELRADDNTATAINAFCLYGSGYDRKSPKFLDSATKQSTLTEEGTAANVITVGSFQDENGVLANSSGRGPTLDLRIKPDITAPGVGILSVASNDAADKAGNYRGCCCDCCEDSYRTMSGTSMAAPHIAGVVALMLQKNKTVGFNDIKSSLLATARPAPGGAPTDDVMGWGGGKVNAKAAVDGLAAVAAPASSGGAGGGPDHFKAAPKTEMQNLQERFLNTYQGKRLKGLLRPFFFEIRTLINTNKKVATVWHRSKGPAWMSAAFRAASQPDKPVPQMIEGLSFGECVDRVAAILKKYCSPLLAMHLRECEVELQRLQEGMNVYQLIAVLEEPAFSPA